MIEDVVEVRPGDVRVVDDPLLPGGRCDAALRQHVERAAQAPRQRAEVHRDVLGLRDEPAAAVEQRARVIEALLDVRRVRRVAHGDAHLFARICERAAQHFGRDRIDPRRSTCALQHHVTARDGCMPSGARRACRRRTARRTLRPARAQPSPRAARAYTGASQRPTPAKYAERRSRGAGAAAADAKRAATGGLAPN